MDNLRGYLGSVEFDADGTDYGFGDDEAVSEPPPSPVGQDERRMQVRAYNHWASLLQDRNFPSIEDLDPETMPDFGPNSVLLDFTGGIDDPSVRFLGDQLAAECDIDRTIDKLSDVPHRSLLTRITDHYMQILANQAPIGFEAEFVNQRGETILYRGILLPYSSDDDTIDFIYGVINWKQMADQLTSDELLLQIDQALEVGTPTEVDENDDFATDDDSELEAGRSHRADPVTDWADGPVPDDRVAADGAEIAPAPGHSPLARKPSGADPLPLPVFGNDDEDEDSDEAGLYEAIEAVDDEPEGPSRFASLLGLGGGTAAGSFDDDEDEDYDPDEDPVAKWLNRSTPLDALPDVAFGDDDAHATPAPVTYEPDAVEEARDEANDTAEDFGEVGELSDDDDAEIEPLELVEAIEDDADEPFELVDMVEPGSEPEPASEAKLESEPEPVAQMAPAFEGRLDVPADETALYDCLAEARELAMAARTSEDRSRTALYAAVGRAYDVSLAAQAEPEEFAELIADSGLTVQDRAPMTPVVKLVFGADYDKTRLTEYAAVLTHAHRLGIERGALAGFLGQAEGGLKGVVQAERALRRAAEDEDTAHETPREALARKLREIAPLGFEDIASEGQEFALVMIRRIDGNVVVLGEIDDVPLVEKAAKKLVA